MQHMFLIRAVCGPGWIHVWTFQLFFFFLQCQWCGNNNWNQFFFDRITSCRAGVLEWQTLFCIFPVREKAKILYELICFWSVMTFFVFLKKKEVMMRDTLVLLTNYIHCFHGGFTALTLFDVWRYEASLKMVYGSVSVWEEWCSNTCSPANVFVFFCYWSQWSISGFSPHFPCWHPWTLLQILFEHLHTAQTVFYIPIIHSGVTILNWELKVCFLISFANSMHTFILSCTTAECLTWGSDPLVVVGVFDCF